MLKLQDLCVDHEDSLIDALVSINANGRGIVFVQKNNLLYGTLTDGDIRRALIDGASKGAKLGPFCNKDPVRLPIFSSDKDIQRSLDGNGINMMPLVNDEGVVVDFATRSRFQRFPVMEPCLNGREREYVLECLDSNWISSQGGYVDKFEAQLAEICGTRSTVSTSSGTTALHLALETLGIGSGDEVIVPNLTFGASVNSILHAGATPILVDVSEADWNICPRKIAEAIGPHTKAIMPVHLYGNPCDMNEIMSIAERHNLLVVEDCAEALGAKFFGKPVGSFGDAAAFSFFANKVITCGEGGAVAFREQLHEEKARMLRDHGMSTSKKYWHELVGYNYRMTNIQAAIGCAQLENIEQFDAAKAAIWNSYEKALLSSGFFTNQVLQSDVERCRWLFTLVLIPELCNYRDQLCEELRLSGIDTRPMFYPMSEMPAFVANTRKASSLVNSKALSAGGISFPSSVSLSSEEIAMITQKTLEIIVNLKNTNRV